MQKKIEPRRILVNPMDSVQNSYKANVDRILKTNDIVGAKPRKPNYRIDNFQKLIDPIQKPTTYQLQRGEYWIQRKNEELKSNPAYESIFMPKSQIPKEIYKQQFQSDIHSFMNQKDTDYLRVYQNDSLEAFKTAKLIEQGSKYGSRNTSVQQPQENFQVSKSVNQFRVKPQSPKFDHQRITQLNQNNYQFDIKDTYRILNNNKRGGAYNQQHYGSYANFPTKEIFRESQKRYDILAPSQLKEYPVKLDTDKFKNHHEQLMIRNKDITYDKITNVSPHQVKSFIQNQNFSQNQIPHPSLRAMH